MAWTEDYVFNQQHLTTRLLHNYCFLLHLDFFKSKSNHKSTGPQVAPGLPHAGLTRLLGRKRWSTNVPKRSKKQWPKDSNPRRWV
jgi:hypothetical protein